VAALLGNGDGTFQTAIISQPYDNFVTFSVGVGDVNGDGKPDALVPQAGVWLGNGNGTFQAVDSGNFQGNWITAQDINGDGKLDAVVVIYCNVHCVSGEVSVYIGNGNGTFQSPSTYDTGGIWSLSAAMADVDGDGNLDLLVSNSNSIGVLLGNGDGTFRTAVTYGSGGTSVAAGDVNGDGKPDMLVTDGADTVHVFLNTKNTGNTQTKTTISSSPNPSTYGSPVTLTAQVQPITGSGTPTGNVTFSDSGTTLGIVALSGGIAALPISTLPSGLNPIAASYGGDGTYAPSVSPVLNQQVNQATSVTTLSSSPDPSYVKQSVTLSATVAGQYGGTPTESVKFREGKKVLGAAQLVNGQGSLAYTFFR
jgi:hypothetical protein